MILYDYLIDLKPDGSFRLNLDYFNYCTGLTMTNERFNALFGGPPRKPEMRLEQRDMDLAASIQTVLGNPAVTIVLPKHELDLGFLVGSESPSPNFGRSYRASHAQRSTFEALTAVSAMMVAQTMSLIIRSG